MVESRFEQMLGRLLKQDFSAGTEAFRDALLSRCLEELGNSQVENGDFEGVRVLDDFELDLLAAAGDVDLLKANASHCETLDDQPGSAGRV